MELALLKLFMLFVSVIMAFIVGMSMPFLFFYCFFGIPTLFLPGGFWRGMCQKGFRVTWDVNKWFLQLPWTIANAVFG